jgi:small subunit ribosomal protein S4
MAKYTGPVCKLCRREGEKLFLKGTRCYTPKCAFERRDTPPGMHGRSRRMKQSEYGLQLREKQKLKRMYGVLEKQFRLFFDRANKKKGLTGGNLLVMLESRLDNIVFKAGFAQSLAMARQTVNHSLITVNGRKVDIASFIVSEGDVISCRENDKTKKNIKGHLEEAGEALVTPEWLQVDKEKITATVLRIPQRNDITASIDESLIVELYSK